MRGAISRKDLAFDSNARLLCELGFTKMQANIYLTLLMDGKTDAKKLSLHSQTPRTAVYRALDELQRKGLAEREIGQPLKFRAVPPSVGLQNSIIQKFEELKELEKRAHEFMTLNIFDDQEEEEQDYRITILDGRRRIIQELKDQHNNAKRSIDVITVLPRWLQFLSEGLESCESALKRGVKYRLILGESSGQINFPKLAYALMDKPNFQLKWLPYLPEINSGVYDGKQAVLIHAASKSISESALILTNHPSVLSLCQKYFDSTWKETPELSVFKNFPIKLAPN